MSQDSMLRARQLIQEKRYAEARRLLRGIDTPKAREWERKLDAMGLEEPDFLSSLRNPAGESRVRSRSVSDDGVATAPVKRRYGILHFIGTLFVVVGFLGLLAGIVAAIVAARVATIDVLSLNGALDVVSGPPDPSRVLPLLMAGVLWSIGFLGVGQLILLLVSLEAHTRATYTALNELLERFPPS